MLTYTKGNEWHAFSQRCTDRKLKKAKLGSSDHRCDGSCCTLTNFVGAFACLRADQFQVMIIACNPCRPKSAHPRLEQVAQHLGEVLCLWYRCPAPTRLAYPAQ